MAMNMAGSAGGGGGRRGRRRAAVMAEINVTPMVDVMLVLLIIFMVAAPLMTVGVPVDLPKTNASQLNQDNEPITITVNPEGKIFLQETEVPIEGLVAQLQAIGLVAAIPATIFYNKFAAEVNKQAQRMEGFADEFSAILSRQIDERLQPRAAAQ